MKKYRYLSLVISFVAILIMCGWWFDINFLKSAMIHWQITTKPITALCFFITGVMFFFFTFERNGEWRDTVMMAFAWALIIIAWMVGYNIAFFDDSAEWMSSRDNSFFTIIRGAPSPATLFGIILLGCTGFVAVLNTSKMFSRLKIFGTALIILGGISIIGYITNNPALFYYKPNSSNGMSIITAIMFVYSGVVLIGMSKHMILMYEEKKVKKEVTEEK